MRRPILLATVATLAIAPLSFAQTVDERRLDTVTVSGLQPVDPATLTEDVAILTEDDLAVRDTPFVADQLRAVPGVAISRSGSLGGLTQVRIRGAEANHTLVFLDGIEFSDPVTGETDFGLLSGLDIARIEVLRGEQSSLYGSDAIGGVLSIETSDQPGFNAEIEAGSRETVNGSAGFNTASERFNFGGAVSGFTTEGVDSSGLGGEKDGSDSLAFLARGGVELGTAWNLSVLATYREAESQFDSDTDFDGLLNNVDRTTDSEQTIVGAALTGKTGRIDHVFRANLNEVDRTNRADGTYTDSTSGERTKLSWSPSITVGEGSLVQTFSALVDHESEDYERRSTDLAFGDPNQSQSFETFGIAGEYRLTLNALQVNASARFDDNDGQFEDAVTWRAGAAYSFDFGGRLRASAGSGVKNPTFTELFGFYPGSFIGNPDLEPEKSTSWEIGWDQTWDQFSASITYFEAELEDEIYTAFTPTFLSTAANRAGDSKRSGVEIGAKWTPTDRLDISGQFTSIDSEADDGSDEIRVPADTASIAANWRVNDKGLRIGAALDYVGEQDDFDFGSFPSRRVTLDAYTLASLTAEIPVTERLAITLRGSNLFDEQVTDVYGYRGPGAGAFIGLKLR